MNFIFPCTEFIDTPKSTIAFAIRKQFSAINKTPTDSWSDFVEIDAERFNLANLSFFVIDIHMRFYPDDFAASIE